MSAINLKVNGKVHAVNVDPTAPLLYVLSDDLALNGPKFGCGLGQCGACTVIVKGQAIRSCITPVKSVEGAEITTLEGIGTIEKPHPLQQAFIEEQAAQCGFCANGVIMTAKAFLDRNPKASDQQIQQALTDKGYFKGEVNGQWGDDSVDALKRFQADQKLDDDGHLNSLTLIGLGLGPKHDHDASAPAVAATPASAAAPVPAGASPAKAGPQ